MSFYNIIFIQIVIILNILFNKVHPLNMLTKHLNNNNFDSRLDSLYEYYKTILSNNNIPNRNKQALIETLSDVNSLKDMSSVRKPSINFPSFKQDYTSFLQSSSIDSDGNEKSDFSYQPFVWTKYSTNAINKPPASRKGHSAVIADTYMIIFGGCYLEYECFNDLFFLDLRNHNWIEVPTSGVAPSPRSGHSAVLYGDTMWVFGGGSNQGYFNDLHSLNLETVYK